MPWILKPKNAKYERLLWSSGRPMSLKFRSFQWIWQIEGRFTLRTVNISLVVASQILKLDVGLLNNDSNFIDPLLFQFSSPFTTARIIFIILSNDYKIRHGLKIFEF